MRDINFADDLEKMVGVALYEARIEFEHESEGGNLGADFYLPECDTYIEVKKFHSDRAIKQLAGADNAILLQGKKAVEFFCDILNEL